MSTKTATIIGATGLIGNEILQLLSTDDKYGNVRLLVRRPYQAAIPRAVTRLIDFSDYESFRLGIEGSDAVFCAVGTTQKKVQGDKSRYRKVDHDIPVLAARICKDAGCERFITVSSVGADIKSKNFYLQLKGEVEEKLKASGLQFLHIMRPSILLGNRQEFRLGEKIGQGAMQAFSFVLACKWKKYKPVQAKDVAAAMIACSKKDKPGFFVHEWEEIMQLSNDFFTQSPLQD